MFWEVTVNLLYGFCLIILFLSSAGNENIRFFTALLISHKFFDMLVITPNVVNAFGSSPVLYFYLMALGDLLLLALLLSRKKLGYKLHFLGVHCRFIRYPHEFIFTLLVAFSMLQAVYTGTEVMLYRLDTISYESVYGYHAWEHIRRALMALAVLILVKLNYDHLTGRLLIESKLKL